MVEAGADEVPEETLLEALELAHDGDPQALRGAGGAARQAGKPKWLDPELTAELEAQHGRDDPRADPGAGPARGRRGRRRAARGARPVAVDGLDRRGHRPPDAGALEPQRAARERAARRRRGPGARAVRGRPAGADGGRAGLEGAQVREAAPALRPDHRDRRAAVPGRPGDGRRARPRSSRTRSRSSS